MKQGYNIFNMKEQHNPKLKKTLTVGTPILTILAIISVIGVGFSSRAITKNAQETLSGKINADDVIDTSDYLTFGTSSMFGYCKSGVVEDETIVYKGDLKIPFSIKMKGALYPLLATGATSLTISTNLCTTVSGLVSSTYLGATPTLNYGISTTAAPTDSTLSATGSLANELVTTNITYTDSSLSSVDILYYLLVYHFDFTSDSANFETNVYDKLKAGTDSFDFKVVITI